MSIIINKLYLDCNAHIPLNQSGLKAFLDFQKSNAAHGNPNSLSSPGREAANAIESARASIANKLGISSPKNLIFTSSATQACEWAVKIISKSNQLPTKLSPLEHWAVRDACLTYLKNIQELPVTSGGIIDEQTSHENYNVVCMSLQNEIGTPQPAGWLRHGNGLVFSDITQSLGKEIVDFKMLDIDIAAFGAHKFGGPSGVGFLYLKDISLWKEFGTGSRYFLDRTGTPDIANIVATDAALTEALNTYQARYSKMLEFQEYTENELQNLGIEIIGKESNRNASTSFIHVPGQALELLVNLSSEGIHVGLGSACGSFQNNLSYALQSIGRKGNTNDYLRISNFGYCGKQEAIYFIEKFNKLLRK